jgi:hypothetical protein
MRLSSHDIRDLKLFKYYRLVRKWACDQNGLNDADLELLMYLDCLGRFNRKDYMDGTYAYRWDKHRWERLRSEGWISVWRERNRTTQKYAIYQVSQKGKNLIMRIYRILLGEEDVTLSSRSVYYNNKSYTAKVRNKAIDDMVKDKDR